MKNSRKITSILLLVAMLFMIATPAMATGEEETYSITINNTSSGHTYEVYQIFTGDLSEKTITEGESAIEKTVKVLSNVQWGNGVSYTGTTYTTAQAVADALAGGTLTLDALIKDLSLSTAIKEVESNADRTTIDGLVSGYYLVKDKDNTVPDGDAYTKYIVQVVGNAVVNVKGDKPSSEKKVKDINDSTIDGPTDWQDSADYDIGDKVPFQLKGTLPSNYNDYETYELIFHDKQSKGLTFDEKSVKVYVDGTVINGGYDVVVPGTDGCTFEVKFTDLKTIAPAAHNSSEITVEYESTLNDEAMIGSTGNPNEMHMEFSNNPNGEGTGKTPDDKVIVFTYKTVINKVDQNEQPLTGAEFTLEKFVVSEDGTETYKNVNGNWVAKTVTKNDGGTEFTFRGLDDGEYRLKETTTPAGYNTIADIYFTITATHDITSDNPALTDLNGTPTKEGEITFTKADDNSSLTATVVNQSGSTLPETGGIGTTIFYAVGGILVVGAGILLVTKRRMG